MALEPTDDYSNDHFMDFYSDYNCDLKPGDQPVSAMKMIRDGDNLYLHVQP